MKYFIKNKILLEQTSTSTHKKSHVKNLKVKQNECKYEITP